MLNDESTKFLWLFRCNSAYCHNGFGLCLIKHEYDERCEHEEKLRARREYNEMFEEWQERNEKVFQQSDLNRMAYEDDMEYERRKKPETYKK